MSVETTAAAGYGLVAGAMLLAQAANAIPGIENFDIGPVASVGFAVWYGWYVTSRAIPRIVDKHDEAVSRVTQAFESALADLREERERDRERFVCRHIEQAK